MKNIVNPEPKYDVIEPKNKLSASFSISIIAVLVANIIASFIIGILGEEVTKADWYFYFGYIIVSLSLIIGIIITSVLYKTPVIKKSQFAFKKRYVLIILLIFFGTFFGLSGINDYFVLFLQKFGYKPDIIVLPEKNIASVVLTLLIIAVIPAIAEELLFRGVFLSGAAQFGFLQSIFVTAACFSIYHMSPAQTIYQFIIGAVYAVVALTSKSPVPTMILHFLNNAAVILNYYFFPDLAFSNAVKLLLTILGIIMTVLGIFLCFFKEEKYEKVQVTKAERLQYICELLPGILICLIMWVANLIM